MTPKWLLAALTGLSACGCSAPYKCEVGSDLYAGEQAHNVETEPATGSQRLAGDDTAQVRLRATLSGLPRLWQESSNIVDARVLYRFSVEYEDEPKGNDGKTEMPRVAVRLSIWGSLDDRRETISSALQQGEVGDSLWIFRTCRSEDEPNCCRYGAETCSLPLELRLTRVDAAPFPPVVVSWSTKASAQVSPCPLESEVTAELALQEEP